MQILKANKDDLRFIEKRHIYDVFVLGLVIFHIKNMVHYTNL